MAMAANRNSVGWLWVQGLPLLLMDNPSSRSDMLMPRQTNPNSKVWEWRRVEKFTWQIGVLSTCTYVDTFYNWQHCREVSGDGLSWWLKKRQRQEGGVAAYKEVEGDVAIHQALSSIIWQTGISSIAPVTDDTKDGVTVHEEVEGCEAIYQPLCNLADGNIIDCARHLI